MARSGLAQGANKGHVTEQRDRPKREAAKKAVSEMIQSFVWEMKRE